MVLYGSNDGIPSSGSSSPTECTEEVNSISLFLSNDSYINVIVSGLLLHGYEALLEREVQKSVLSGHQLHHDVQPEFHGGNQPVELQ